MCDDAALNFAMMDFSQLSYLSYIKLQLCNIQKVFVLKFFVKNSRNRVPKIFVLSCFAETFPPEKFRFLPIQLYENVIR